MSEKYLRSFENTWQAEAFGHELEKLGIKYRLAPRAREYASVLLGGNQDAVDMFVNEHRHAIALETLKEMLEAGAVTGETSTGDGKNYFKRVILLSFMGICILPIIFNLAAIANFRGLRNQNISAGKKNLATAILVLGWLGAFVELGFVLSIFFK